VGANNVQSRRPSFYGDVNFFMANECQCLFSSNPVSLLAATPPFPCPLAFFSLYVCPICV